jgi:hypothetical protein
VTACLLTCGCCRSQTCRWVQGVAGCSWV